MDENVEKMVLEIARHQIILGLDHLNDLRQGLRPEMRSVQVSIETFEIEDGPVSAVAFVYDEHRTGETGCGRSRFDGTLVEELGDLLTQKTPLLGVARMSGN